MDDTTFEKLMCGQLRRRMWTFLERPGSSFQAKAFELSSTLFVAISVMGLSFGTIPDFQVNKYRFWNAFSLKLLSKINIYIMEDKNCLFIQKFVSCFKMLYILIFGF